jgi:hypothetical protein
MTAVVSRIAESMQQLANRRLIIGLAVVLTAFAALLFGSSAPFSIPHVRSLCGQPPPDVRFFTSAADVHEFLVACGDAGRAAYRNLQIADLIYPVVFGSFMASSLAAVFGRITRKGSLWVAAAALPLAGAGFDYLENVAAWISLAGFPAPAGSVATMLGLASPAKQVVSWAAGLLLVASLSLAAVRQAAARQRSKRATATTKAPAAGTHRHIG